MQAVKLNFTDVLKIEGNVEHYHIPKYQREYTWNKHNWEVLINDIIDNDPDYFIGSLIVVNEKTEGRPGEEKIYQVIDGQQRLTTLSILITVIYNKYNELFKDVDPADEDIKTEFTVKLDSLRKKLIKKKDTIYKDETGSFKEEKKFCFLRVQPSSQNQNLADYKYILFSCGLIKNIDKPKNFGNRLFSKAYNFFFDQIPNDKLGLDSLIEKINRLILIHISVSNQSDAFTLFETLNNRGVPLSAIDIIKNSLLAEMEKQHKVDVDESYEKWQDLLEYIPDFDNQQRFLRQYYNAFKVLEDIKHEKITRATRSNILLIYDKLIKKNAEGCFNELLEKGKIYGTFIDPSSLKNQKLIHNIIELNKIGAAASYTFLLYLFCLEDNSFSEIDLKEKVVALLCKYYFRRNITDYPNTRDLDAINIDLVEQCHKHVTAKKTLNFEFIESIVLNGKGKPAELKKLTEGLADNLFYNNEGMARYALTKLDETSHTREYSPNLWARNEKNLYVWTIEHVFPQGKRIPKDWVDMIGGGNKEDAEKIQGELVHCLGNLTLSGYNSRLSAQAFDKKQGKADANVFGNKIQIGYKNGLALNNLKFKLNGKDESLSDAKEWKKEHITARNEAMVSMLTSLFKFSNE